jgi:3-deoxy-D-manno-octulosonate 8-phosphate phosphatase (KDO 8-P phosphatase)
VIEEQAARIRLILFDVDGVLTDGTLLLHADGTESKVFDIKDGTGIVWAQRLGLTVGFLSARSSAATAQRATQLGITLVHQGVSSKLETYEQIADSLMLEDEEVAYMGDDILDLPVLARVGLAAAPADAAADVRERVHWIAHANGGAGAARELIELILRAQGLWDTVMATYLQAPQGHQS